MIGQRQYSSYQQHADPEADHKGSQGYQGHPKEEATAPYEESIRHKETTKEKRDSRPRLRWGTCSTNLCRICLICKLIISWSDRCSFAPTPLEQATLTNHELDEQLAPIPKKLPLPKH